MASRIYANFLLKGFDGSDIDLVNDTIKVALADSGYTPDFDAHDFFDDVTNEEAGTGYTAGGATLANKTWAVVGASDVAKFDADDVSWPNSTITTRWAIPHKSTGTASTSPLICAIDFSTDRTSDGGTFLITWHANGIFTLGY